MATSTGGVLSARVGSCSRQSSYSAYPGTHATLSRCTNLYRVCVVCTQETTTGGTRSGGTLASTLVRRICSRLSAAWCYPDRSSRGTPRSVTPPLSSRLVLCMHLSFLAVVFVLPLPYSGVAPWVATPRPRPWCNGAFGVSAAVIE